MLPVFGQDMVDHAQEAFDDDLYVKLFAYLADKRVLESFAELKRAAGILPLPALVARPGASLREQHPPIGSQDDAAHADPNVVSPRRSGHTALLHDRLTAPNRTASRM